MGLFSRFTEGLTKSRESFREDINLLLNRGPKVDEEFWEGLEETLILSDMGGYSAVSIVDKLRNESVRKGYRDAYDVLDALNEGKPARAVECDDDEKALLAEVALLTNKPVIFAANMSEDDFANGIDSNERLQRVREIAAEQNAGVLPICAEMEAEIVEMDKEEKEMFLSDLGLEQSGLDRLINECYTLLGLISYLTAGKPEVRAWTIKKGTKAPQAAGKIHTDFERGFIRAEVIAFDDLIACGSMTAAKEKGLVRSEGKEYVMKDGDVVLFRFNV